MSVRAHPPVPMYRYRYCGGHSRIVLVNPIPEVGWTGIHGYDSFGRSGLDYPLRPPSPEREPRQSSPTNRRESTTNSRKNSIEYLQLPGGRSRRVSMAGRSRRSSTAGEGQGDVGSPSYGGSHVMMQTVGATATTPKQSHRPSLQGSSRRNSNGAGQGDTVGGVEPLVAADGSTTVIPVAPSLHLLQKHRELCEALKSPLVIREEDEFVEPESSSGVGANLLGGAPASDGSFLSGRDAAKESGGSTATHPDDEASGQAQLPPRVRASSTAMMQAGLGERRALLVVGPQVDLIEGGLTPVRDSIPALTAVDRLLAMDIWDLVVLVILSRPATHPSFAMNHPGECPFDLHRMETHEGFQYDRVLMPAHCIADTPGACSVLAPPSASVLVLGEDPAVDPLGAFADASSDHPTALETVLREKGISDVYVAGFPTEHYVAATAIQAVDLGFTTVLVTDAVSPWDPDAAAKLTAKFRRRGGKCFTTENIVHLTTFEDMQQ